MKFPVVDVVAEVPRLVSTSCRKVVRSGVVADVVLALPDALLELFEELLPESDETRLLKSDWSVLRVLFVDEVVEVVELPEPVPNCEINCSSLLEKLE